MYFLSFPASLQLLSYCVAQLFPLCLIFPKLLLQFDYTITYTHTYTYICIYICIRTHIYTYLYICGVVMRISCLGPDVQRSDKQTPNLVRSSCSCCHSVCCLSPIMFCRTLLKLVPEHVGRIAHAFPSKVNRQ